MRKSKLISKIAAVVIAGTVAIVSSRSMVNATTISSSRSTYVGDTYVQLEVRFEENTDTGYAYIATSYYADINMNGELGYICGNYELVQYYSKSADQALSASVSAKVPENHVIEYNRCAFQIDDGDTCETIILIAE